ncbi:MAG: cation diffusion facilitator family transporter [Lachnospiraceae bacterium]|nr:cation diffusion facilitator family transporter [Lachnospiraceae bacterium]
MYAQKGNKIFDRESKTAQAMRVSALAIVLNLALSAMKFVVGALAHSSAMISDAVHSATDVFSTFAVMIGIRVSGKSSDREHPYGHERYECVVSVILAIILAFVGIMIGVSGVQKILAGTDTLAVPGSAALVAAVISIAVKEWMFHFTRRKAKSINSTALMADAWHHRSDALSSIGAFVGIFGARLGFKILDPIASIVICVFIVRAAWKILKDATDKMVDHSASSELTGQITRLIGSQSGVEYVDDIKTRLFAAKLYVDVEIAADGNLSLTEAHGIAQRVEDAVESGLPEVKHCMVHVNPSVHGEGI